MDVIDIVVVQIRVGIHVELISISAIEVVRGQKPNYFISIILS